MCCGQKRMAMRSAPAVVPKTVGVRQEASRVSSSLPQHHPAADPQPRSPVSLRYLETSPIRVHGPVTGRLYEFSGARPVQMVEAGDAAALARTRFFRQTG
jgi:hypothetical protein